MTSSIINRQQLKSNGRGPWMSKGLMLCCALLVSISIKLPAQVISNNGAVMSVTSGTVLVGGDIGNTTGTISNNGTITLSGAYTNAATTNGNGTYNIAGNWLNNGGTFTAGSSIVNLNGSSAQSIGGSTSTVFSTLQINNAAGVTLGIASTVTTLTIGNITANSVFDDGGFGVTSTGTLNLASGTFRLGSAGSATAFPLFASSNISAGTTVQYASGVAQTISTTPNYSNLVFSGAGTKTTAAATLTISGNWTVGSATALNTSNTVVNLTGSLTMTTTVTQGTGAISVGGNWTNNGGTFTAGSGGTTFNGSSPQAVNGSTATTFTNLTLNNSTGLTNTTTTTTVTGTVTLTSGTYTLTSGLTLGNGATIVRANGSLSAVPVFGTTVNVQYTNSGTINTGPELPTVTTVLNNLTINNTAAVTLTAGPQVNGTVTLTTGQLAASSFTMTVLGNWTNNGGSFTPGTGTVILNGSSPQTISAASSETFNTLQLSNSGTKTFSSGTINATTFTISTGSGLVTNNGILAVGTGGLTVNSSASLLNSTGSITITGADLVNNGTVTNNGSISAQ